MHAEQQCHSLTGSVQELQQRRGARALEQQVSESGAMKLSGLGLVAPPMEAADTVPVAAGVQVATALPAAATRAEKGLMTVCAPSGAWGFRGGGNSSRGSIGPPRETAAMPASLTSLPSCGV